VARAGFVLLAALALGCATKAPPPKSLGRAVLKSARTHRVRAGETLTRIAEEYGTTPQRLAELNRLADPDTLRVGQVLRLPPGTRAKPARRDPGPPPALGRRAPDPVVDCGAHGPAPEGWAVSDAGLAWPTDGVVLTRFGNLEGQKHEGLAIGAPLGTPVWASAPGEVILAGKEPGYGHLVVVQQRDRRVGLYASLERACIGEGRRVARGDLLGLVGASSGVASPRLYFELRENDQPVDPLPRLP
jgi:lipoprotein NlpD